MKHLPLRCTCSSRTSVRPGICSLTSVHLCCLLSYVSSSIRALHIPRRVCYIPQGRFKRHESLHSPGSKHIGNVVTHAGPSLSRQRLHPGPCAYLRRTQDIAIMLCGGAGRCGRRCGVQSVLTWFVQMIRTPVAMTAYAWRRPSSFPYSRLTFRSNSCEKQHMVMLPLCKGCIPSIPGLLGLETEARLPFCGLAGAGKALSRPQWFPSTVQRPIGWICALSCHK